MSYNAFPASAQPKATFPKPPEQGFFLDQEALERFAAPPPAHNLPICPLVNMPVRYPAPAYVPLAVTPSSLTERWDNIANEPVFHGPDSVGEAGDFGDDAGFGDEQSPAQLFDFAGDVNSSYPDPVAQLDQIADNSASNNANAMAYPAHFDGTMGSNNVSITAYPSHTGSDMGGSSFSPLIQAGDFSQVIGPNNISLTAQPANTVSNNTYYQFNSGSSYGYISGNTSLNFSFQPQWLPSYYHGYGPVNQMRSRSMPAQYGIPQEASTAPMQRVHSEPTPSLRELAKPRANRGKGKDLFPPWTDAEFKKEEAGVDRLQKALTHVRNNEVEPNELKRPHRRKNGAGETRYAKRSMSKDLLAVGTKPLPVYEPPTNLGRRKLGKSKRDERDEEYPPVPDKMPLKTAEGDSTPQLAHHNGPVNSFTMQKFINPKVGNDFSLPPQYTLQGQSANSGLSQESKPQRIRKDTEPSQQLTTQGEQVDSSLSQDIVPREKSTTPDLQQPASQEESFGPGLSQAVTSQEHPARFAIFDSIDFTLRGRFDSGVELVGFTPVADEPQDGQIVEPQTTGNVTSDETAEDTRDQTAESAVAGHGAFDEAMDDTGANLVANRLNSDVSLAC